MLELGITLILSPLFIAYLECSYSTMALSGRFGINVEFPISE